MKRRGKHLYRGPITALTSLPLQRSIESNDGLREVEQTLCWGSGGTLHWLLLDYHPAAEGNMPTDKALEVFDHHTIHGLRDSSKFHPNTLLIFGERSLCLVSYDSLKYRFEQLLMLEDLHDVILDAIAIPGSAHSLSRVIVVGYAHNYFDILDVNVSASAVIPSFRCHCPERSVPYALTFQYSSDTNDIIVASGTIFGKIVLWKSSVPYGKEYVESIESTGVVLSEAHRHEGAIYKLIWSKCGTKLISVADDRTLRLWTIAPDRQHMEQVFEAWGHISRPWDAVFLNKKETQLASCSEDGTIRLWSDKGECMATLRGHNGSIWCLAILDDASHLISGGNDASLKFWDIQFHRHNSPFDELRTVVRLSIDRNNLLQPKEETDTSLEDRREDVLETDEEKNLQVLKNGHKQSHSFRRNNGVAFLTISPTSENILMVSLSGAVLLSSNTNTNNDNNRLIFSSGWHVIYDVHSPVVAANATFLSDESIEILVAAVDGSCCYITAKSQRPSSAHIVSEVLTWIPHPQKTVNLWSGTFHSHETLVVTATINGLCRLWIPFKDKISLVGNVQTGRKQIATSQLILMQNHLILGDSRGGIGVYNIASLLGAGKPDEVHLPQVYFPFLHGRDPVSALAATTSGFISVGHNSSLCFFHFDAASLSWTHINSISTLPVHTPTQLYILEDTATMENASIYVCGYHGSSFIVHDIRR